MARKKLDPLMNKNYTIEVSGFTPDFLWDTKSKDVFIVEDSPLYIARIAEDKYFMFVT